MTADCAASSHHFFAPGGVSGLLQAHDWSEHPLGEPAGWPEALRTAVAVCLDTPTVSAIYWGRHFHVIYNDAYALALAERHPAVLGKSLRKVWPEIWEILSEQVQGVVDSGHGFTTTHQPLVMLRNGERQETFWIYTFTPLRLGNGRVGGCVVTALETTPQILAERALARERDQLEQASIALRRSEDRLQRLNDNLETEIASRIAERDRLWKNARDMQVVVRANGTFKTVNPAVTAILGWKPEEMIGKTVFDFIHPEGWWRTWKIYCDAPWAPASISRWS